MNLKELRAAAIKAAQEIIMLAENEKRGMTDQEFQAVDAERVKVEEYTAQIERGEKADAFMNQMAGQGQGDGGDTADRQDPDAQAKSLGDFYIAQAGDNGLTNLKNNSGFRISTPEWSGPPAKANTDDHGTPGTFSPWLTDYDRTIVREFRRPTISDLLGSGSLSGNAVTYLVEGAVSGDFGTVAPGGPKPQFHLEDPTQKSDALKKIAGFLKILDEMAEDAPFWVSEINQRGLYMLALAEERQLLRGDGTGQNVEGLLTRSGIQTETSDNSDDNADALFRAATKVETVTGFSADGIIIHPTDYQNLRLKRDGNGQYLGGGFFEGQYGNGGISERPPLWGYRTVVTPAAEVGTAVVGAFKVSSTVYRKGGVRVESTNSHAEDFTSNKITTRIEERVALAVRYPAGVCKVTLDDTAPAAE